MSEDTKIDEAQCCCGQVSLKFTGGPKKVLACSCDYCQRRTGSIIQFSAWYTADQIVSQTGEVKHYQGPNNPGVDYMFCPECGSTVYWEIPGLTALYGSRLYGVAVGNFADRDYPQPTMENFVSNRHHWLGDVGTEETNAEVSPFIVEALQAGMSD